MFLFSFLYVSLLVLKRYPFVQNHIMLGAVRNVPFGCFSSQLFIAVYFELYQPRDVYRDFLGEHFQSTAAF